MYLPKHFEETNVEAIFNLMRSQPLATLITSSSGGLNANHIPLLHTDSPTPFGKLQGHVPRSNPLASSEMSGLEALAIFHGPNAYISPSWYASKRESGQVVPTWNYMVVHVYGQLRIIDDPVWVRTQVEALTELNESQFEEPWKVSDAPDSYVNRLIRSLVGIELEITKLVGKKKASQNQPSANRAGVLEGLKSQGRNDFAELVSASDANPK